MLEYQEFLKNKIVDFTHSGFDVAEGELDGRNLPHQNDVIRWALKLGRAGIFARFGLGKTRIQCQLAKIIHERTGKRFLIICPLAAKHQFQTEDGPQLGMEWVYITSNEEAGQTASPYLITNYERVRDGGIHPEELDLAGVSLDEGSILRNMSTKTVNVFRDVFAEVPFRFVATATPDPNNVKELIYFAEWLGVKDHGYALTKWFKRNPKKAGDLRLIPQHEKEYWLWVASWALFLYSPSDLGYSDEGYALPELKVFWHSVAVDYSRAWSQVDDRGQRRLLLDSANGTSEAVAEARATLEERLKKAVEIIEGNGETIPPTPLSKGGKSQTPPQPSPCTGREQSDPTLPSPSDPANSGAGGEGERWLIWHDLEDERRALERSISGIVTVFGSQKLEVREQRIIDFAHGKIQMLGTKPSIAGSGCNFQYFCHKNIFLSINYNFEDIIQAIHRTYRFQQSEAVEVHFIYAESQGNIVRAIRHKWEEYDKQSEKMREIVRRYGLSHEDMHKDLERTVGVERVEVKGELFTAVNNDCVPELRGMADNSVDMIVTSIPFGNHYEYTTHVEDFGHNPSDEDFWVQMGYLIPELLRVIKPGHVAAVHVKDRILYGHQTRSGFMEVEPFVADTIFAFTRAGWMLSGYHHIITDVVRENASTYRLGWSEMSKDSTKMGAGLPEELLIFRKQPSSQANSYADDPVKHDKAVYTRARWQIDADVLWRSNGNTPLLPEEYALMEPQAASEMFKVEQLEGTYDYERHVAICEALDKRGRLPSDFMLMPPKVTKRESDMVWDDITFMRTLNSEQARRAVENHICPLPIDIVSRAINLYSEPGDLVLDPFGGLGTTGVVAIKNGRRAMLVELSKVYFASLVKYCRDAEEEVNTPTLFDLAEFMAMPENR